MLSYAEDRSSMMTYLKKLAKSPWTEEFFTKAAAAYIRLIYTTTGWRYINFEVPESYLKERKPFIACFWHAHLLMLPYAWKFKGSPFYMLISSHKDGRLISATVSKFGISTIAGSTRRKGAEALLEIIKKSRQGATIGITPDGPRGPEKHVSEGTIAAAHLAKADLLPVTYITSHHKILNTWDKFLLPLPFGKGVFMWGKPIPYPKSREEFLSSNKSLAHHLDALQKSAQKELS